MSNGRHLNSKKRLDRDGDQFIAMPMVVLDCPAFARLGHPAKSLLLEIARQYVRDNNGRLLASIAYLKKRGWNSSDVITRAKRELLASGFIFETVKGHRPNKASWYAITWHPLDRLNGYDHGAVESFKRSAYRDSLPEPLKTKPTRQELIDKWKVPEKSGDTLKPASGADPILIAPSGGLESKRIEPSCGPIKYLSADTSAPSHGHHLDTPSADQKTGPGQHIQSHILH